jgi:hypothetical protein
MAISNRWGGFGEGWMNRKKNRELRGGMVSTGGMGG